MEKSPSDEEIRKAAVRFGETLNLTGPAPIPATQRMLADAEFAKALYAVRNMPEIRDQMLAAPETARIRKANDLNTDGTAQSSSASLVTKAAGAVLKWGMEGLEPVQPWILERRLAACAACEFQKPAPKTLIYRGIEFATGKNSKICSRCMCLTNTKAAIPTERCPEKKPDDPSKSRWDEPWQSEPRVEWIWE